MDYTLSDAIAVIWLLTGLILVVLFWFKRELLHGLWKPKHRWTKFLLAAIGVSVFGSALLHLVSPVSLMGVPISQVGLFPLALYILLRVVYLAFVSRSSQSPAAPREAAAAANLQIPETTDSNPYGAPRTK